MFQRRSHVVYWETVRIRRVVKHAGQRCLLVRMLLSGLTPLPATHETHIPYIFKQHEYDNICNSVVLLHNINETKLQNYPVQKKLTNAEIKCN